MTARFFDHQLARARGQLGPSRVRPQAAPRWAAADGELSPELPLAGAAPAAIERPVADPWHPAESPTASHQPATAATSSAAALGITPPGATAAAVATRAAPPPATQAAQAPSARSHAIDRPAAPAPFAAATTHSPPPRLQPEAPTPANTADDATPHQGTARPAIAPRLQHATPAGHPSQRSAGAQIAAAHEDSTVVHVSIGRVELFAPPTPPAVRAPRTAPRGGSVPLADYLRGKPR